MHLLALLLSTDPATLLAFTGLAIRVMLTRIAAASIVASKVLTVTQTVGIRSATGALSFLAGTLLAHTDTVASQTRLTVGIGTTVISFAAIPTTEIMTVSLAFFVRSTKVALGLTIAASLKGKSPDAV